MKQYNRRKELVNFRNHIDDAAAEVNEHQVIHELLQDAINSLSQATINEFVQLIRTVVPWEREQYLSSIIRYKDSDIISEVLSQFWDISNETTLKLLDKCSSEVIVNHLDHFKPFNEEVLDAFLQRPLNAHIEYDARWFTKIVLPTVFSAPAIGNEMAMRLIDAGYLGIIFENRDRFPELSYTQALAERLIEHGQVAIVAKHLQVFKDLDATVARQLVAAGYVDLILTRKNRFPGLECNSDLLNVVLASSAPEDLYIYADYYHTNEDTNHLQKFTGLNNDHAKKLIQLKLGWMVLDNLDRFPDLQCDSELAKFFIINGDANTVFRHLDRFPELQCDSELAQFLLDHNAVSTLLYNLGNFGQLTADQARALIIAGEASTVFKSLEYFSGLRFDAELAKLAITHGSASAVFNNLEHFPDLELNNEFVKLCIHYGNAHSVFAHADRFPGLRFDAELAKFCITHDQAYAVFNYLNYFSDLQCDNSLAQLLIDYDATDLLVDKLSHFDALSITIAQQLLSAGYLGKILSHSDKFPETFFNREFVLSLIETDYAESLFVSDQPFSLRKLVKLDSIIANWFIAVGKVRLFVTYLDQFTGLNKNIAYALVGADMPDVVFQNFHRFFGLRADAALAQILINHKQESVLGQHIKLFSHLTVEQAHHLIINHQSYAVLFSIGRFPDLQFDVSLAQFLVDHMLADTLRYFLGKFSRLTPDLAKALIAQGYTEEVMQHLDRFPDLECDAALANLAIIHGNAETILSQANRFPDLQFNTALAQVVIDHNPQYVFPRYVKLFTNLENSIGEHLIAKGHADAVFKYLDRFPGLQCDRALAERIINSNSRHFLASELKRFGDLTPEIAQELMIMGSHYAVFENLHKFPGLQFDTALAQALIDLNATALLVEQLKRFESLDRCIAAQLFAAGRGAVLYDELSGSLNESGVNEQNWMLALMMYIRTTLEEDDIPAIPAELSSALTQLFEQDSVKDFCYTHLEQAWREHIVNTDAPSRELEVLAKFIKKCGAGPMSQLEALGVYIAEMLTALKKSDQFPKTKAQLNENASVLEMKFQSLNYSKDDRAYIYQVSGDILFAAPSLYTDFLTIFTTLKPVELKKYVAEILPLYRALLAMMSQVSSYNGAEEITYSPRDLVELRRNIRDFSQMSVSDFSQACEETKNTLVDHIKQRFKDRFNIIKIPEEFTDQHIRSLLNSALYLGNINDRTEKKECILSWHLALLLNDQWQNYRSGQNINPHEYLAPEAADQITTLLKERAANSPVTAEAMNLLSDEFELFQKALPIEVSEATTGEIETLDVQIFNVVSNLETLADPDAYASPFAKMQLELLQTYGSKLVNVAVGKLFQQLQKPDSIQVVTPEEGEVQKAVRAFFLKQDIQITPTALKRYFQDEMKPVTAILNMLAFCREQGIQVMIEKLQASLRPSEEIIAIFNRLGEDFSPASGARAITQDLEYLDQFIVKHSAQIKPDEQALLTTYVDSIRTQLNQLQTQYKELKTKFNALWQAAQYITEPAVQEKLQTINRLIQESSQQKSFISTVTADLDTIIMNIRECLSCVRQGCNNDTNLTFGDTNKFFVYSRSEAQQKGSVSDQIVFFEPVQIGDTTRMAFVMDRIYGHRTPAILENHVKTMIKKCRQLQRGNEDVVLDIFVSSAALATAGLSEDRLIAAMTKNDVSVEAVIAPYATVQVAPSAAGDHYIEFAGDDARKAGPKQVSGVLLRVKPRVSRTLQFTSDSPVNSGAYVSV
jgi:hypothetical protein